MTGAMGVEAWRIKPAVTADEAAVRGCAEAAYAQYVAAIGRKPAPMVANFAGQIADGVVRVAEGADGSVLGFIVFFPRGDRMFLETWPWQKPPPGRGSVGR
ncbi:hypothetical protein [Roseovarius sp.]|uniref:hypothetical protein n=1 Tax=Roseovarius sp. TaxID=1486281 RepID=UPI003BAD9F80